MVGVILGSRFPMLVWWGPEHLQLYNDAYRPVLGVKHPALDGRAGRANLAGDLGRDRPDDRRRARTADPRRGTRTSSSSSTAAASSRRRSTPSRTAPCPTTRAASAACSTPSRRRPRRCRAQRQLRMLRDLARPRLGGEVRRAGVRPRPRASSGTNHADVPFALLYLLEADGRSARLSSTSGLDGDPSLAAPAHVSLQPEHPARPGRWRRPRARITSWSRGSRRG